ncbi:MAG TPA: L-rhamnose isomerase [Candidatus Lokiarchaeia archaeon]|nr:L-rhamnose isomerase [Candidatus Lokiarchaeia archaeon]
MDEDRINHQYDLARSAYMGVGVNADDVMKKMDAISLSIHCWQGDDVGGFEGLGEDLGGSGLAATGNYPGKARTPDELRQDYLKTFELIPGNHRVNLHAMYGEFQGQKVDRDAIEVEHFQGWIDWARENDLAIDFNPTLFAHPKAKSGFTLSNKTREIRDFWIRHVVRCREIANEIGKQLGSPCINNLWIPDGMKDVPVDRAGFRAVLLDSLDQVYATKLDLSNIMDFVEGKLFGIGSEAFVVGSHDFYLGYAIKNQIGFTMDMGHYHPTESVADKISAVLPFVPELLIHVSRGVHWDSDHVAIENDDLLSLAEEIVRSGAMDRIHLSLDYFDASLNRIGAWVIGARATLIALLRAMLQPWDRLDELEENGLLFHRLALLEQLKAMPFGAVWDAYCMQKGVPAGLDWIYKINEYEENVLSKRE